MIRHGCLLHSLARADPRLQLLSNGATWHPVLGSPGNVHVYIRVNKLFAWFNFRRCARATKIKQHEKLKGEVYLTRKFPDLRYKWDAPNNARLRYGRRWAATETRTAQHQLVFSSYTHSSAVMRRPCIILWSSLLLSTWCTGSVASFPCMPSHPAFVACSTNAGVSTASDKRWGEKAWERGYWSSVQYVYVCGTMTVSVSDCQLTEIART